MNPNGKKGCPEHQQKILEIGKGIEKKGLIVLYEYLFKSRSSNTKKRYADVVGMDSKMKIKEIHQVGRRNKNGSPVKRERDAINDIELSDDSENVKVQFHTFIKIIILLFTFGTIAYFYF
ncbi:MAG: hypothetical protein U0W24_10140 [Bacteroidales bacterium]